MSGLAFLHADVAPGGPVARSPMSREAAAAGARCEARDGWEVAVAYVDSGVELLACRESVAWADRSHLGKLELQGAPDALAASFGALAGDGAAAPALGTAARVADGWWLPIAPERALVVCEPSATASLREQLGASFEGHLLDVTTTYGALALAGPLARETFARFCALDLRPQVTPVHAFRPGSVARTPGFVLREAEHRWLMLFGAAYGSYVWEVVADAATHLGGRPIGADALAALSGEASTEEAQAHA